MARFEIAANALGYDPDAAHVHVARLRVLVPLRLQWDEMEKRGVLERYLRLAFGAELLWLRPVPMAPGRPPTSLTVAGLIIE